MKNKIKVEPRSKPDNIRTWIAFKLVDLANWIRPGNEAGMAYWMELMMENEMEMLKYGTSALEVKVRKHK